VDDQGRLRVTVDLPVDNLSLTERWRWQLNFKSQRQQWHCRIRLKVHPRRVTRLLCRWEW